MATEKTVIRNAIVSSFRKFSTTVLNTSHNTAEVGPFLKLPHMSGDPKCKVEEIKLNQFIVLIIMKNGYH